MAPLRTARVTGPSCQRVSPPRTSHRPSRSAAEVSSLQATVTSGRPNTWAMCSTSRDFPQPVGPLSKTASWFW